MKISVVIPACNGETFLNQTIDSAVFQKREPDQLLLVDDASTDATADIAKSYGRKLEYHFNRHPTGFVDAWNRAIELAAGDFVTILHQDDLLHPNYLENIEKAGREFPQVRHFYTACDYIDEKGSVIKKPPLPHTLEPILYTGKEYVRNYLNGIVTNTHIHRCPGVTTQRSLLLNECTYRKEAGHIADDDFFLRVGAFTDVVGISSPLASYRHHSGSETSKLDILSLKLAEAYLVQVQFYKNGSSLLDKEDISKINEQAARFINLLLFQGILHGNKGWMKRAHELKAELEEVIPGFMRHALPKWATSMWKLTRGSSQRKLSAEFYVKALHLARQMRDIGRSITKK
jgi:glycosyltransferase involved in cell wall biosynthesis